MHVVNSLVTITILVHIGLVHGQLYRGDKCSLNNGNTGICTIINQCPQALANIRKGIYPKQCGFEGMRAIVCCPDENPTISTTAAITSTTATLEEEKTRVPGEISKRKCIEYSQYVWTVEVSPLLSLESGYIRKRECPFDRQSLIVGGTPASRREFPHIVQLGYDGSNGLQWSCGGSLISEEFVLTAAHCLSDRSLGDAKYARMGLVDLDEDDKMQEFDIVQIIPHPDYVETSHYHDIGLAKLSKKAVLNSFVRPACLYTNRESPWSKVIACGWGKTDFAGSESNILLKVVLELYDEKTCNKTYRQQYGSLKLVDGIKDDLMICAGHSTEIRDTCQGDSGGPLQVYKTGVNMTCMYDVIGLTSFGKACGLDVNLPAVYTRVSNYLKWIEDHVWPQE